ncbi:hypothetical protein BD770DRAFT_310807, partial [Pilaira anomala]
DHQMLILDLLPERIDIGPGFWRFNPALLHNDSFLELISEVVFSFFENVDIDSVGNDEDESLIQAQKIWESFKRALKDTCERFSRGYNKRVKSKLQQLQEEYYQEMIRLQHLDVSLRTSTTEHRISNDIAKQIDESAEKLSQQRYLRSATRWHEHGERNDKYFYRVIKTRQSQQTIQAIRCRDTDDLATATIDIIREARNYYSTLYSSEPISEAATDFLLDNIP